MSGAERLPDASFGRRGHPRYQRHRHAEGCRVRGHARVDQPHQRHPLLPWLGDGALPLPHHRARFSGGHLQGDQGAAARKAESGFYTVLRSLFLFYLRCILSLPGGSQIFQQRPAHHRACRLGKRQPQRPAAGRSQRTGHHTGAAECLHHQLL